MVACSDWMLASDVRVLSAARQVAVVGRHNGGVGVGGGEDDGRESSRWRDEEGRGRRSDAASVAMMERKSNGALQKRSNQFGCAREIRKRLTSPTLAQVCSRAEDAKAEATPAA